MAEEEAASRLVEEEAASHLVEEETQPMDTADATTETANFVSESPPSVPAEASVGTSVGAGTADAGTDATAPENGGGADASEPAADQAGHGSEERDATDHAPDHALAADASEPAVETVAEGAGQGVDAVPPLGAERSTAPAVEGMHPADAAVQIQQLWQRRRRQRTQANSPLEFVWSFGYGCLESSGVHYLGSEEGGEQTIFYTSGHTGIVYHCNDNDQVVLQGHRNPISCSCVSADKRWIVTCDEGEDAMMIVWDARQGTPVRTYFADQVGTGLRDAVISHDGMYLVTLGAAGGGAQGPGQVVAVWDWTAEDRETPLAMAAVKVGSDSLTCLRCHPENPRQLVANGASTVAFLSWEFGNESLTIARVPAPPQLSNALTQSVYLPGSHRVGTASRHGKVVLWGDDARGRKTLLKVVTVCKSPVAVATLLPDGDFVALAGEDGVVRFFDGDLRLIGWNDSLDAGPINSMSFSADSSHKGLGDNTLLGRTMAPGDLSRVLPNYIVSTTASMLVKVTTGAFQEAEVLLQGQDGYVGAVATHPSATVVCIGAYTGRLQTWDYEQSEALCTRALPDGLVPQTMEYSPDGHWLAVGMANGALWLLDPVSLQPLNDNCVFRNAKDAITHVRFSRDGSFMATADGDRCVGLYSYTADNLDDPWFYVGKHRSHHGVINDLLFGAEVDFPDKPRLLSLGADRMLAEYDLENSGFESGLLLKGPRTRVDQLAEPRAMLWYPQVAGDTEAFLLVANSAYKQRLFNASTLMCRRTLLGPTYGEPARQLRVVPGQVEACGAPVIAYATRDKVGLSLAPLDGNPHRHVAVIAHPYEVADMAVSHDGRYVFTAGGRDGTVHMWQVNSAVLAAQHSTGGEGLAPFYGLIEGGEQGELVSELKDYVYYAQLRDQQNSMRRRKVSDRIPVDQIADIMRAIGFFPTEQQVQEMTNEVRFSDYADTGRYSEDVDLAALIRLYVNHRPTFGLDPQAMEHAFGAIPQGGGGSLPTAELLQLLQTNGEKLSEEELARCLAALVVADGDAESTLPATMTAAVFAGDVLGFDAA